jgi:hypothetical protein
MILSCVDSCISYLKSFITNNISYCIIVLLLLTRLWWKIVILRLTLRMTNKCFYFMMNQRIKSKTYSISPKLLTTRTNLVALSNVWLMLGLNMFLVSTFCGIVKNGPYILKMVKKNHISFFVIKNSPFRLLFQRIAYLWTPPF